LGLHAPVEIKGMPDLFQPYVSDDDYDDRWPIGIQGEGRDAGRHEPVPRNGPQFFEFFPLMLNGGRDN